MVHFLSSDHADKFQFGVVRQFVGHGVGQVFHADPVILHFSKFWTQVNYCNKLIMVFFLFPRNAISIVKVKES